MARSSTSCLLKSVSIILLMVFGLVPLSVSVEAEHGGGGGGASQSGGNGPSKSGGNGPSQSGGKATKATKNTPEIAIPAPVAPQPPRLQGIQFQPDSRCAQLTEAQRRQTPGCGY
jgi:hypothetical protein